MKTEVSISTGKYFPKPFVLLGYIGVLFGAMGLAESVITGIPIILASIFISFNKGTLEIDVINQRLKNYPFLFGLKLGSWVSIKAFKEISVLRINVSDTTYGGRTNKHVTVQNVFFDLYLLDSTHTKKLAIHRSKNYKSAMAVAEMIAGKTNMKVVKYQPPQTDSSRRRRR